MRRERERERNALFLNGYQLAQLNLGGLRRIVPKGTKERAVRGWKNAVVIFEDSGSHV
jgi:hypothetical protein